MRGLRIDTLRRHTWLAGLALALGTGTACSGGEDGDPASSAGDDAGLGGTGGAGAGGAGGSGGSGGMNALPGCDVQDGPSFDELAAPETVYTSDSVGGPNEIALHDGSLILWDGTAVERLNLDTRELQVVAQFPGGSSGSFTLNDTHVFVIMDGQVMRAPLDATDAEPEVLLTDTVEGIEGIAGADAERVYLFHTHTGVIRAVPVTGGTAEEIFNEPDASKAWIEDGFIYYYVDTAFEGELRRAPIGGGTPELVVADYWIKSFLF